MGQEAGKAHSDYRYMLDVVTLFLEDSVCKLEKKF